MSDAKGSTVTYTSISSDDGLSDIGYSGVVVYGYDGLPMIPHAPPSPDYMPGPEEPQAPPPPGFIPEPIYPEFMPPEDDIFLVEEQPLPAASLPTADLSGYVLESDLEENDEDPKEDLVDYPADGGDDDDNDDESSDNDEEDDDDVDIEEDEDEDEEKEEHLDPADSTAVALPAVDHALSAEETEPFETDESAATPPPNPAYRVTARMFIRPQTPISLPSDTEIARLMAIHTPPPSPLSPLSLPLPPILSPLPYILSPSVPPSLPLPTIFTYPLGYRAAMIWLRAEDEIVKTMQGAPATDETELFRRVTDLVETMRRDTDEIYTRMDDAQSERQLMASRLNLLVRDRRALAHTALLMKREGGSTAFKYHRVTGGRPQEIGTVYRGTKTADETSDPDDRGVAKGLATRDADKNTNEDDSHVSRTCARRTERVTRECTYPDFMKCQSLNFKGTKGVVELTQWFEKMETMFHISKCSVENQIKFSTCTLLGSALTWSTANTNNANNQRGAGLGHKTACYECGVQVHFKIECPKLKNNNNHGNQGGRNNVPARVYAVGRVGTDPDVNVMTEKYMMKGFPIFLAHITTNEVEDKSEKKRLKDVPIVQNFPEESDKIERYVGVLPDVIHGSVVASRPKTMQEAIKMANELMDKRNNTLVERQNTGKAYTARSGEKKSYRGSKPQCPKYNYHHDGPCPSKCHKCNKVGHFARDYRSTTNVNTTKNQRGNGTGQKPTCYECGAQGNFKKDCPKLKNNNHGTQGGNTIAPAKVHAMGRVGTNPESNVVTDHYYEVELDDGRIIRLNTILRGCTLNILNHPFNIDLMLVELGSFDVIIGIDWLAKYHAVIVYAEKIVRIPWENEILIVYGDGSDWGNETRLNIISCTKTQKYMLKGCHVFLLHVTTKETEDKLEMKRLEDMPTV
nr:hypothetical protein [Tanacetum cinerariifolium]